MRSSPVLGLITVLTVALAQSSTNRKPPLVSIPVLVTDEKMKFITDLDKDDFRIFENKTEQMITQFSRRTRRSLSASFSTPAAAWGTNSGGRGKPLQNS
jgi:hypothetical protein